VRIRHRKTFHAGLIALTRRLSLLGFPIDTSCDIVVVNVYEDDPRFGEVERCFEAADVRGEFIYTEYTEQEIESAERLLVSAKHLRGLVPDGWSSRTYGTFCRCGLHGPQIAPYRFTSQPKFGATFNAFLCDGWREELFLHADAWRDLHPLLRGLRGATAESVLRHKTGETLPSVVQLRVDSVLEPGMMEPDLPRHQCPNGHRWALWKERGSYRFRRAIFRRAPDFAFAAERVGNEIIATKMLIVSQAAASALRRVVRGFEFRPLELVDS
jgi:hypothetical protein